ncbi:hypothetical protein BDN70DRAFT_840479 [Pholiota conissans]|uniref:Stress-activated map kinase-interacting protein n=1 Tax=Pholiota conissans TaxID=109636 RepID=A0A9P6CR34_9AGAR|nr:hypothetical protein BDN70DRAFT_840479 [Pholiota conissans]
MSLLRDTDFLIHHIRLAYLRNVDDPHGARIISLDPGYQTNSYIIAASLADHQRWPELGLPSSPNLSDEEEERDENFTNLKTRFRLNNRTHVPSSTAHTAGKDMHDIPPSDSDHTQEEEIKNFIQVHAPVEEQLVPVKPLESWIDLEDKDDSNGDLDLASIQVKVQEPSAPAEAPVANVVQFIPKFKAAAEMEARRRLRIAARRGHQAAAAAPPPPAQPPKPLTFDSSSSEDETGVSEDESLDEFEDIGVAVTDIGDEFDPDYAATSTRTGAVSDSAWELTSNTSTNTSSLNHSPNRSPSPGPHKDARTAASHAGRHLRHQRHASTSKQDDASRAKLSPKSTFRPRLDSNGSTTPDNMFAKKKVAPIKPLKSALSAKIAAASSVNPFTEMYATISGRGATASTKLRVFFPHAEQQRGLALTVRSDATVEEVIGFALWSYWEERWSPKLDDGLSGEDDPKWATRLSTVGWILRMAEDDGEVDDDCPAPDRTKKAKDFSNVYAVLEATPLQIQQNQLLESQIQRRPSAVTPTAAKKPEKLHLPSTTLPSILPSTSPFGMPTALSSSHGPQILLRIHLADAVQFMTTIQVYSGTYMQEALELVCRRQRIENQNDYALLLADKSLVIPLDRTAESLQGKYELSLVKRSMLPSLGLKNVGKTTDPNASIFTKPKRFSDNAGTELSLLDFRAAYKKYTIYRKIPMLVARQERTLAIDGDYIHIMPSANKAKAVFDNGKTSSFHIKSIAGCAQPNKNSAIFKLMLIRATTSATSKRYDFEAETPKLAAEIVANIKGLRAALDRTGPNKSRRSRQLLL